MNPGLALGVTNIGAAVFFILVSIPLIQGKVGMNRVYGVRIRKAFESEENWYRINAFGGRRLAEAGIILALAGVATFFLPYGSEEQPNMALILLASLAPLIVLMPFVIRILVFASRLPPHR